MIIKDIVEEILQTGFSVTFALTLTTIDLKWNNAPTHIFREDEPKRKIGLLNLRML